MNGPGRVAAALPVRFTAADIARARAQAGSGRVVESLEAASGLAPDDFVAALAACVKLLPCRMSDLIALEPNLDALGFADALRHECMVGRLQDGKHVVVVADPFDDGLRDRIGAFFGYLPEFRVAHRTDIAARLHQFEETARALGSMDALSGGPVTPQGTDLSFKSISEDASPVVRLVNSTLHDAIKSGASDIHLECVADGLAIKYRIDGVLASVGGLEGISLAEQSISRVKVMAELDISERRVPQDGRFHVQYQGREIDLRVSIMPSIHGEDAVLRILDRRTLSAEISTLSPSNLGFDEVTLNQLRHLSSLPYGMFLVTGPTGSGKTTTLYALIGEINTGQDKIITIEDPVEYQLPGVLQIPVNEKKGLTFARGLRSILRHDPDKILVGEIRDGETAQIAMQAALTGHLVFTTVHANSALDVLGRFAHMGVDPYTLVAALNGVVAQRLLRVICSHCMEEHQPSASLLHQFAIDSAGDWRFRIGRGCGHCRGTGYRGRKAVAEVLILDDRLREMIVERASVSALKDAMRERGGRLLRDAALMLARTGETSLEELHRVIA